MIKALILLSVAVTVYCATMPPATGTTILYDMKHHKAMIVKADGCYEYHMDHQDVLDSQGDAATKAALEARMIAELATATNIQEVGHHHIDHMSQDIRTACASIPVFSWDRADVSTVSMTTFI